MKAKEFLTSFKADFTKKMDHSILALHGQIMTAIGEFTTIGSDEYTKRVTSWLSRYEQIKAAGDKIMDLILEEMIELIDGDEEI